MVNYISNALYTNGVFIILWEHETGGVMPPCDILGGP